MEGTLVGGVDGANVGIVVGCIDGWPEGSITAYPFIEITRENDSIGRLISSVILHISFRRKFIVQ